MYYNDFILLDGLSSGAIGQSIRQMVKNPRSKPEPAKFDSIECPGFPNLDHRLKDRQWLNSDMLNVYLRAKALISGMLTEKIADQILGNITGARWLTKGILLIKISLLHSLNNCKLSCLLIYTYNLNICHGKKVSTRYTSYIQISDYSLILFRLDKLW